MKNITITLTDAQYMGLSSVALSPEEWAENAIVERCKSANDDIVQFTVQHLLNNNIAVPPSREEIVAYAFDNKLARTAAEVEAELTEKAAV